VRTGRRVKMFRVFLGRGMSPIFRTVLQCLLQMNAGWTCGRVGSMQLVNWPRVAGASMLSEVLLLLSAAAQPSYVVLFLYVCRRCGRPSCWLLAGSGSAALAA
jgi:hypothetical protein